jgi:hypothetical protein
MKYDDASWHYGGNFPKDLPPEAGATHISMFVIWAWLNGLAGILHAEEIPEGQEQVRKREKTPGKLFIALCDEKFTDEDLNAEGNAFAEVYYAGADGLKSDGYLLDYSIAFPEATSPYHVPDSWASFDRIAPLITSRFDAWRKRVGRT